MDDSLIEKRMKDVEENECETAMTRGGGEQHHHIASQKQMTQSIITRVLVFAGGTSHIFMA